MIQTIRAKGLSTLGMATIGLFALSLLIKGVSMAVPGVILWAGFQSMIFYYAVLRFLCMSNGFFLSIFVGDALVRFVSLGVVAILLSHFRVPWSIPLGTLAMAYVVFSLLQIPFLHRVA